MIPSMVEAYLSRSIGDILRNDPQPALAALDIIGASPQTEFGQFFLKYQGSFVSPRAVAELLDIVGPEIPAILDQTVYARDRYGLSHKYIALTSDESEGMYLYNLEDMAVYDFDLGSYGEFMRGQVPPTWRSFNKFLEWYFDES